MRRAQRLIRCGFCLIPWLPAFLLSVSTYAYLTPRRYVAVTTLKINLSPDQVSIAPPARGSFAPERVVLPLGRFLPERMTLPLLILICTTDAFVLGCALLWIGFRARSALKARSVDHDWWQAPENHFPHTT